MRLVGSLASPNGRRRGLSPTIHVFGQMSALRKNPLGHIYQIGAELPE